MSNKRVLDVAIRACDSDWQSDFNQWKQLCKDALKIASKANAKISKTGDLKDKEFKQLESEWKKADKAQVDFIAKLGTKYKGTSDARAIASAYDKAGNSTPYYEDLRPTGLTFYSARKFF